MSTNVQRKDVARTGLALSLAPASSRRSGRSGLQAPREHAHPLSQAVIAGSVKLYDFAAILAAGAVIYAFYKLSILGGEGTDFSRYALITILAATVAVTFFQQSGAYSFKRLTQPAWQMKSALLVCLSTASLGLLVGFLAKMSDYYSRGWVLGWLLLSAALLAGGRLGLSLQIKAWLRQGRLSHNVIVVGAGEHGARLIAKLRAMPDENIRVVGIFDDRRSRVDAGIANSDVLGSTDDLLRFARSVPVDEIIVALPLNAEERVREICEKLKLLPVDLRLSLDTIADRLPVRGISHIGSSPAIEIAEKPLKHWAAVAKWLEDKLLSALLLCTFGPAMLIIAALIKLDSPGPVFFVQERFGFNNRPIRVLKFRTMFVDRGDLSGAQQTVRNDPRVTRVGWWLRRLSLDELPQFINVLRGDMSLIGPRAHALTMRAAGQLYYEAVEEYFMRHRVRPGLTGWAQVHGLRGETDTLDKAQRRVEYDLWYIDHWSLWLDLRILFASSKVFFARENAY